MVMRARISRSKTDKNTLYTTRMPSKLRSFDRVWLDIYPVLCDPDVVLDQLVNIYLLF